MNQTTVKYRMVADCEERMAALLEAGTQLPNVSNTPQAMAEGLRDFCIAHGLLVKVDK